LFGLRGIVLFVFHVTWEDVVSSYAADDSTVADVVTITATAKWAAERLVDAHQTIIRM